MNRRLGFLLALLLGCAAATAAVIMTYRAPLDPQVERSYAEWTAHWKHRLEEMIRAKRYPEAERAIRNYLRHAPEDGRMRRMLGKVMCENGNYAEAGEVYYVSLLKTPGDFVARNNLGVTLARRRRLADARRELREAYEISDGAEFIGFNLSRVHAMMGEKEEAQRILKLVVKGLRRSGGPRIPEDAVMLEGFSEGGIVPAPAEGSSTSEDER